MKTYYMGRFAIDLPVEMKQAVQSQSIRHAQVKEFEWSPTMDRTKERMHKWNARIQEIDMLEKPEHSDRIILKEQEFTFGRWAKAVCYYGDYIIPERHFWAVLADYGEIGVWLILDGTDDQLSIENFSNVLAHFHPRENASDDSFHLKYGIISLPYLEQEKTYARFEGYPLNLKVEVEMQETFDEDKIGIGKRLAASIATRYAPGVDVVKIRSCGRTVAGVKGEELVMKMSAVGEETEVQFFWEYNGQVNSGTKPEIQITMETTDGGIEEKLRVWDAILDSMNPLYR